MASSLQKASFDSAFNLDSLLDTITCLVGVLLVVMAVIQVGLLNSKPSPVPDYTPPVITSQLLDLKESELTALAAELRKLRDDLGLLEAKSPEINEKVVNFEKELAELRASVPSNAELAEKRRSAEKERVALREQEKQHDKALAALRAELAKYTAQIAENRISSVITLPEARTIEGAFKRVTVMIRHGRVYLVQPEKISRAFADGLEAAASRITPDMNNFTRLDMAIKHFEDTQIATDGIRLRLGPLLTTNSQRVVGFRIKFELNNSGGESLFEMQRPQSDYRKLLASVNPKADYVAFSVWSDSFETFLAARSVASDMHKSPGGLGTPLGMAWTLYAPDEDFFDAWTPTRRGEDDNGRQEPKRIQINN